MRYNKTLGIVIATILSGGIGLAANAGEFTFAIGDDTLETEPQAIASEGVDEDGGSLVLPVSPVAGSNDITTWFEFERDANIIFNIYIDYTLTGGTFNADLVTPVFTANANVTAAAVTRISGGSLGDNTVRYLLQAGKSNIKTDDETGNATDAGEEEDRLILSFAVQEVEGLANNGGTVKLKAEWGAAAIDFTVDDSASATLFDSTAGVTVTFDDIDSPAKIDVTEGSKKFDSGINGSTTIISLGTILINGDATYPLTNVNEVDG